MWTVPFGEKISQERGSENMTAFSGEKISQEREIENMNLKEIKLPDVMRPYVKRIEFILGPLRSLNHNCSVLSYGGKTYLTITRRIRGTELEQRFFHNLRERGVEADVSSCC